MRSGRRFDGDGATRTGDETGGADPEDGDEDGIEDGIGGDGGINGILARAAAQPHGEEGVGIVAMRPRPHESISIRQAIPGNPSTLLRHLRRTLDREVGVFA